MTIDVKSIKPETREPQSLHIKGGWACGETVAIRDFDGKLVCSLRPIAQGDFLSAHGIVAREDVGEYILRVTGHPSLGRSSRTPTD